MTHTKNNRKRKLKTIRRSALARKIQHVWRAYMKRKINAVLKIQCWYLRLLYVWV